MVKNIGHERPTFSMSADTRAAFDLLASAKVGGTVTYDDLAAVTRRDVRGDDRYVVASARRALEREGVIFGVLHGVGLKRLTDAEILADAERAYPRIRRASRRAALRALSIENFDALSAEDKSRHNAMVSVFGAVAAMTDYRSIKKIEQRVSAESKQTLSLGDTLEAFRK